MHPSVADGQKSWKSPRRIDNADVIENILIPGQVFW